MFKPNKLRLETYFEFVIDLIILDKMDKLANRILQSLTGASRDS